MSNTYHSGPAFLGLSSSKRILKNPLITTLRTWAVEPRGDWLAVGDDCLCVESLAELLVSNPYMGVMPTMLKWWFVLVKMAVVLSFLPPIYGFLSDF